MRLLSDPTGMANLVAGTQCDRGAGYNLARKMSTIGCLPPVAMSMIMYLGVSVVGAGGVFTIFVHLISFDVMITVVAADIHAAV
jgi:hypothetical protein